MNGILITLGFIAALGLCGYALAFVISRFVSSHRSTWGSEENDHLNHFRRGE